MAVLANLFGVFLKIVGILFAVIVSMVVFLYVYVVVKLSFNSKKYYDDFLMEEDEDEDYDCFDQ